MLHLEEFNAALERAGLPPTYRWDAAVLEAQQAWPGRVGAVEAFSRGVKALFVHAAACEGRDDFATMVMTEPENFGLTASATPEQIRNVIVAGLADDKDLGFHLLPESTDTAQDPEVKLFPPEYGESVKEFWIWVVRCPGFFPGPAWMLVSRENGDEAFHYGYL
jgi:hypothetical protein